MKQRTQLKETWPYFRPKENFNFHSYFQTWPLKFIPLGGNYAKEFAFFFFFLIHLELKRQIRSYTPVIPSKTIPNSKPKWAKCISVFNRPKKRKNHTLWGGTYLCGSYKEISPGRKSKYLTNSVRIFYSLTPMSYIAVICVLRLGGIWLNFGGNNVDLGRNLWR